MNKGKKIYFTAALILGGIFISMLLYSYSSANTGNVDLRSFSMRSGSTTSLYVAMTGNVMTQIDLSTHEVLGTFDIGFTPSFPANQINAGSIFWGTSGGNLFGFNISALTSVVRDQFYFMSVLPVTGSRIMKVVTCQLGQENESILAPTRAGVATAGGGTWTAVTPDGKKVWVAARVDTDGQNGLYQLFDGDPASGTFGTKLMDVDPVTGKTINASSTELFDFATQYSADGGTMPGTLGVLKGGSTNGTTAGPCDMSMVTVSGVDYAWGVDVNGDTTTGINASTGAIVGQAILKPLAPSGTFVGPFMGTVGLAGTARVQRALHSVENRTSPGSESIIDVTDPANPTELMRIFTDFTGFDFGTGTLANYTDVSSTFASTLTGAVSTIIYRWTNPDPGFPEFLTDGLAGSGISSEFDPNGGFVYLISSSSSKISVVDLSGDPPWVVIKTIDTLGGSVGTFNVDGSEFYSGTSSANSGSVHVIQTSDHTVSDLIAISGRARSMGIVTTTLEGVPAMSPTGMLALVLLIGLVLLGTWVRATRKRSTAN